MQNVILTMDGGTSLQVMFTELGGREEIQRSAKKVPVLSTRLPGPKSHLYFLLYEDFFLYD